MTLYEITIPDKDTIFKEGDLIWIYQDSDESDEVYIGIYRKILEDNPELHQVHKFTDSIWRTINITKSKISKRTVGFDEELFDMRKKKMVKEGIKFDLPKELNGSLDGKWRSTL